MKRKKLLKILGELLDSDKREMNNRQDKLKEILTKLRKKEHQLMEKIELEENEKKCKRLRNELAIVHAQRSKGIALYKSNKDRQ